MKEYISLNGEPIPDKLPIRSLFYGEGVFETFRLRSSLPVLWERHLSRMRRGAEFLGIPFLGPKRIGKLVEAAVSESGIPDAYVKICLLSGGSTLFHEIPGNSSLLIVLRGYRPPKTPIKAFVSNFSRSSSSPILSIKSLNYLENIIARREAIRLGFDEAIFLNERGEITEGCTSNIFWLKEGVLFTPSLECGLLPGVIRGAVIELAVNFGIEVVEGRFDLGTLLSAQVAFFSNSLAGVVPASRIYEVDFMPGSIEFLAIEKALSERLEWTL
jgi:4-amino-4-deoxychorismate lyase